MALDNVKQDINRSAEAAVAEINLGRDAEIAKIRAEADAAVSGIKEKEEKRLKEAVEHLGRQELSSAELESKKIVLTKKKEILAQTFSEMLAELESATDCAKKDQYRKMVAAAKKVIKDPVAYCAKGESMTAADIGVTSLKKVDGITGGLILESKDGTMRVDMQYRTILQTIWDREMKQVSKILFG